MKQFLKFYFLIGIFQFISLSVFSQGEQPLIDEGAGILKIHLPVKEIKLKLKKSSPDKMQDKRMRGMVGSTYSTVYTTTAKAIGLKNYFGCKINSIEVYSNNRQEDGEEGEEKIQAFILYLEHPKTKELGESTRISLLERYKEPNTFWSPDFTELVYYSCYSDLTLLTFMFGIEIETGNKTGFYEVIFSSAGGW